MPRSTAALLFSIRTALGPALLVAGAWYAALVWIHLRTVAAPAAWWTAGAAGLTALAFIACGLHWLRTPPSEETADLHVAGALLTVLANDALYLFLFPEPQYLHALAVVLVAGGLFLNSSARFLALMSAVVVVALVTAVRSQGIGGWTQPAILLATCGALAAIIHIWRRTYLKRLEVLRLENEAHQSDLEQSVRALALEVAERERLQVKLVKAQNLESLGRMAGGVAHDFNNLLMIILGHAELARNDLPQDAAARSGLDEVITAAERASLLTSQLLSYAGRGHVRVEPVELNGLIRETLGVVRASLGPGASLAVELRRDDLVVDGDPGQLQQIVMNLLSNAAEALPGGRGKIRVSTGVTNLDDAAAEQLEPSGERAGGAYVYLEVRDTGTGISAEQRPQIFDPFFTTKPQGRGLGLAAALGIARSHGGGFTIDTAPGGGSCFSLLLPAAEAAVRRELDPPITSSLEGRTVLVVDDEEAIRRFARRVLERRDCRVREASNGDEALDIARQTPALDAVILDMTMPGRSSGETFHLLREARAGLPILLTSGYEAEQAARHLVREPRVAFLRKPYPADELVAMLSALFDAAARVSERGALR